MAVGDIRCSSPDGYNNLPPPRCWELVDSTNASIMRAYEIRVVHYSPHSWRYIRPDTNPVWAMKPVSYRQSQTLSTLRPYIAYHQATSSFCTGEHWCRFVGRLQIVATSVADKPTIVAHCEVIENSRSPNDTIYFCRDLIISQISINEWTDFVRAYW